MKTLHLAVALAALVASTSLASALPLKLDLVNVGGNSGIDIPIKVDTIPRGSDSKPYIPIILGTLDLDPPAKPQIPIIPGVLDLDPPVKPQIPIIPGVIKGFKKDLKTDTPMLLVDCMVKDTAPTTDDLWLVNVGGGVLPAGLKIQFSVPSTGDRGAFLLNRSIASGHKVKVADLLHGAQSGAPCRATIL